MLFSFVALVLGAGPGTESAEALFKKVEQQILKCKTLQTEIEIVAGPENEIFMAMKGRMLVAAGNKVRMDLEGEMRKEKDKVLMVSDGSKMSLGSSKRPGKEQEASKSITEASLASYSRGGIVISLVMARASTDEKPKAFDIEKDMAISDFKFGKKEVIGGVEAQAIEYKLVPLGSKDTMAITVWIDLKTNLPVKRVALILDGKQTVTVTEKYAKTVLDGKIDEKEFQLGEMTEELQQPKSGGVHRRRC